MAVDYYRYPEVLEVLKGFLYALKNEMIIYENDLILYHNPKEVPSSFFIMLGRKLRDFYYTEEQAMEIAETMSLMSMALESNLMAAGMAAKNPTWYIYISKVKYGYNEGTSTTTEKFLPPVETIESEAQILEAAERKESKLQQIESKSNHKN